MPTPTTAEVGRFRRGTTVARIDGFRGQLITADHAEYDIARAVWNGAIDRRPRFIARCNGTADVVAAVRFAREHDLEIAIRGGEHNVAGTAVCDEGIVIDLSPMRAVHVDPIGRRAWVQGGALWGDVDHETQAFGLATTGGIVSHTGVAGLTLGGGVGWLMRAHGLTIDNLLAADVVTADGEVRRASAHEHPDLFWALRGGGGNFGVVTSFEFRLHPVGPRVLAGPVLWDAKDVADVLRFYREFIRDAPDELGTVVRFGAAPPVPDIPDAGATAFGNRQASHAVTLDAVWRPGEKFGDQDVAWTREFFGALAPFRDGVYVNFLGGDEDPGRVREAYGNVVYDRLVEVKTRYDPDNAFHHNQNIRPMRPALSASGAGDHQPVSVRVDDDEDSRPPRHICRL